MRGKILKIRVTNVEEVMLRRKAKESGRTLSRYLRESGLGQDIQIQPVRILDQEEKERFRVLAGIANNLNQISKKYNQGERMHIELIRTLGQVQQIINKLIANDR
jgi:hypothetical protein